MSIGSTQQLYNDSCGRQSDDYSSSINGGHLSQLENNRKVRREIANSNERKRMECINTGFQSLKMLLPHKENEKLSKAMILQQTAQYILNLEKDKTTLLQQNTTLKRLLANCECQTIVEPAAKRQRCELSSEEISNNNNDVVTQNKEIKDVKGKIHSQNNQQNLKKETKQEEQKTSNDMEKSGQNLDSIVLAIKHLEEGDETPTKQNIFNVTNVKSSKRIII